MPDARAIRRISLAAFASWAVLVAMQLQVIPFARYAWGFDFWQYLPPWCSPLLGVAALALCSGAVRSAIARGAVRLEAGAFVPRGRSATALALAGTCALLWLVRERQMFGDSSILLYASSSWSSFHIPEIGATFLIGLVSQLGRSFGLGLEAVVDLVRFAVCLFGTLALLLIWRATRYLTPGRHALGGVLLLVAGGTLRIFAGHFEVYAFVLAAAAAYLWAALAYLEGRAPWLAPCLALGAAVWVHFAAVCLIPSLLLLPRLSGDSGSARNHARRLVTGIALVAAPCVGFLLLAWLFGAGDAFAQHWGVVGEILGTSDAPGGLNRWLRGWGGEPSAGTDYVFLSVPHLKYLANAAHVLAPGVLPALMWFGCRKPQAFRASLVARFLLAACLPLLVYALLLRPIWGPFDWDLFAITAFFLAASSAHLLSTSLRDPVYAHVVVWIVGFALLFVGIPFLAMGVAPAVGTGPFSVGEFDFHSVEPGSPGFEFLERWL